jgi:hypothetical protein
MSELVLTPDKFSTQHPHLKAFIARSATEKKLHTVIIRVQKRVLPYLESQKY